MAASITTWGRLEPIDQSTNLQTSLSAAIADPLWLLHRQWQFGELTANDAGTPIAVTVERTDAPLNRYRPGDPGSSDGGATTYDPTRLPLEPIIESERVRGLAGQHGRLAAESGLHFMRLLRLRGFPDLAALYRTAFALALEPPISAVADPSGSEAAILLDGRAVDGDRIAAALQAARGSNGQISQLPDSFPPSPAGVLAVAIEWLAWYEELLIEPGPSGDRLATPDSWQPPRFEYQFATSVDVGETETTFGSTAYDDGQLDWPDLSTGYPAIDRLSAGDAPRTSTDVRIPTPLAYPGMPAHRHWEIEDSQISFAGIQAGSTDLIRMVLTDFALIYGEDWFLIPIPATVGSVLTVDVVTVRDTFGVASTVPFIRPDDGDRRWAMFALTPIAAGSDSTALQSTSLLVPPTLRTVLSGDPIEETAYFRDEQANLVWAVERTTASPAGTPVDRYRYSQPFSRVDLDVTDLGDAEMVYRLNTPIPGNWYPYLPVSNNTDGGITLRRLPARVPDGQIVSESVEVEDEEISRGGLVTERTWQFARWTSGQPLLWLGRRVHGGRGEGSSGLKWDRAEPR